MNSASAAPGGLVVDTSAMVAILLGEPQRDVLLHKITAASSTSMSAGTYLECALVIDARVGPANRARFDQLLSELGIEVVQFTPKQAQLARDAAMRFGRGSGHPASLNFGDCMSYALAADACRPLLFVGNDFGHTDITAA